MICFYWALTSTISLAILVPPDKHSTEVNYSPSNVIVKDSGIYMGYLNGLCNRQRVHKPLCAYSGGIICFISLHPDIVSPSLTTSFLRLSHLHLKTPGKVFAHFFTIALTSLNCVCLLDVGCVSFHHWQIPVTISLKRKPHPFIYLGNYFSFLLMKYFPDSPLTKKSWCVCWGGGL